MNKKFRVLSETITLVLYEDMISIREKTMTFPEVFISQENKIKWLYDRLAKLVPMQCGLLSTI